MVWGFSFELTNNYRVWNMGCERSLAFFLSEKIILYPTTYFKPSLDGVCEPTSESHRGGKEASKPRSAHTSVTGCPLARLPRSQIYRPSFVLRCVTQRKLSLQDYPLRVPFLKCQGSSRPVDGAVCCPVTCSKSTYAIRGHLKAVVVWQYLTYLTQ